MAPKYCFLFAVFLPKLRQQVFYILPFCISVGRTGISHRYYIICFDKLFYELSSVYISGLIR